MIAIIANPNALRFDSKKLKTAVQFLKTNGVSVDLFFTQKAKDGTDIANKIASKYSIIAAYGGDGIINEVINADLGSSALGILPAGTTNVLAVDLGIPMDIQKAAELFIRPKFKRIYLGKINNQKFTLMAGIGFDACSVMNVDYRIKRISGKASYFLSGIMSYLKSKNYTIKVKIGDMEKHCRWVVVSKAKKYAGSYNISQEVDVDKPLFDVCIFKPILNSFFDLPIANLALFSNYSHKFLFIVEHIITNEEIFIEDSLPIQIDGDFFGIKKANISLCSKALSVVVP